MFKNVKALLFDMDGTLVDSMWMWKKIDIEYLSMHGIDYKEGLQENIEGLSFEETAVYFKEHFKLSSTLSEIKKQWNDMAYDKYKNEVPAKNGVKDFLELAKSKGYKMGIATSNSRTLAEVCIKANGIAEYFDYVITADEVKKGKPNPEVYLTLADKLSVKPENCMVFEDIIHGIMAGRNAGMQVCAVEDDYSLQSRSEKQEAADYYITDFTELLEKL